MEHHPERAVIPTTIELRQTDRGTWLATQPGVAITGRGPTAPRAVEQYAALVADGETDAEAETEEEATARTDTGAHADVDAETTADMEVSGQ